MLIPALRRLTLLVAIVVPFGCGDPTGPCDFFWCYERRLESVTVSAYDGTVVEVGDTLRLIASGSLGGTQGTWNYAPVLDAVWATSDPGVARLETAPPPRESVEQSRRLVRGVRSGTTRVTAESEGIKGEVTVRVIPVLGAIRLSLPTRITVGDTVRIAAAALEPDGSEVSDVPITFAATGGVTLSSYDRSGANVIATAAGPATLSVRFRRVTGELALVVASRSP